MAITNKEIIMLQVERINTKMKTDYEVKSANGHWYLCRTKGQYELPPWPLSGSMTRRTSAQMIEYLRGVEDAVDVYTFNKKA